MQVEVAFSGIDSPNMIRYHFVDRVQRSFEKFRKHVQTIRVHVEDVNGPKGGIDKQCRLVLQLRSIPQIVIQDRDSSLCNLLDRVTDRATHSLSRKIDRLRSRKFTTRE